MRTKTVQMMAELEVGVKCWYLTVDITAHCYPAEPMVRYYRDGSGYPGSPAFAELDSVYATEFYTSHGEHIKRDAINDGWFKIADDVAYDYISVNFEDVFESDILELANDND